MAEEGGAEGIVELDGRGGCGCCGCGCGHVLPTRRAEEEREKKAERRTGGWRWTDVVACEHSGLWLARASRTARAPPRATAHTRRSLIRSLRTPHAPPRLALAVPPSQQTAT